MRHWGGPSPMPFSPRQTPFIVLDTSFSLCAMSSFQRTLTVQALLKCMEFCERSANR
jgi:hypothetical protein